MDPLTLIVTAISAGAAAGLKSTAETALVDAYKGFKSWLTGKYDVDVAPLEKKPDSEAKRQSLAEDLGSAGAADDKELLERATALLREIKRLAPEAPAAIGIDLENIEAIDFTARGTFTAKGTGIKVRNSTFSGSIDISDVHAGGKTPPANP